MAEMSVGIGEKIHLGALILRSLGRYIHHPVALYQPMLRLGIFNVRSHL